MSRDYGFLAFDFGAESGRALLGRLSGGESRRISLEEIHRFPTEGITLLGTRQWDVTRIYEEMLTSLRKVRDVHGPVLDGIAVDTWGVDFGLVARDGTLLANPVHYRDHRTDGMLEKVSEVIPREEMYRETGIQFMQLNTAFQLYAMVLSKSPLLDVADSMLMMNDLFTYFLCGKRVCEYTNASTTQLLNPHTKTWHDGVITRLGIPRRLFLSPTSPGTIVGALLPEIARATGLSEETPVIAGAGHDTACAVAAVPCERETDDWSYLSSGTWSLMGAELRSPCISEATLAWNFTNEGGVCGTIRFLKNIVGLWLVQECRRAWSRDGEPISYAELTAEAAEAEPFAALINVDNPCLLAPDNMPVTIGDLCEKEGFNRPAGRGATIRCALESLALAYRVVLRKLDEILDRRTRRLHVIGGGVQNKLLCGMTADACGIPVTAGPVEATGLGNIMVQALATGAIQSLEEGREVIGRSAALETYEPGDTGPWDAMESRLLSAGK